MKFTFALPLFALGFLSSQISHAATSATCDCEKPLAAAAPASDAPAASAPAAPDTPRGHPLKGVIVAVLADKSALLVKHEEIPGVMKAMTMLLKVDAATLAAAKKDQAITATLVKKADGWWLEAVRPVSASE